MDKEIKEERTDDFDYTQYDETVVHAPISPSHPDLQTDQIPEQMEEEFEQSAAEKKFQGSSQPVVGNAEMKPWYPSAKGRSIVWDHITWVAETQRAACNYCQADFQIKGGTSALLRHLKTVHPVAINFDPENPPRVIRRKAKKKPEDYAVVNADTKNYVDNLLETFGNIPQNEEHPSEMLAQNRADSEIDEVIRSLQKETAQMNGEQPEQDPDIRRLLGIEEQPIHEELLGGRISAEPPLEPNALNPDEEKQVTSSSGQRKRRIDDVRMAEPGGSGSPETFRARRPPGYAQMRHQPPIMAHQPPSFIPHPPPMHIPAPSFSGNPTIPTRYNSEAIQILDIEAKVLYNQSMHAAIKKEEAETEYFRMQSRKLELEIKRMERDMGEESRSTSSDEQEHEHNQRPRMGEHEELEHEQ